jgi:LysM repeat protein
LAQRPDQNLAMHRVRSGDTLGAIARKYGSSIDALRKANRLRNSFLRISQMLKVPLRGPCTKCPVPPPVIVPPRRTPPVVTMSQNIDISSGAELQASTTPQ